MISFRQMRMDDIAAGMRLCRAANWNQLERDWQLFLQLNPVGCRVAIENEEVIGTVTTLRYENLFGWIGMVLVDPSHRRRGIGMQLLQQGMDALGTELTNKLDATPAGREVYLKFDFQDEYTLSRMLARVAPTVSTNVAAQPLEATQLGKVHAYDLAVFGADRSALLNWQWEGAPQYAFGYMENENLKGYCLGRKGFNYEQIGPVVADALPIAKDLLTAALNQCAGKMVILDILHFDQDWLNWIEELGFSEQRRFTRMYRGLNTFQNIPQKQWAIMGPEFG